MHIEQKRLNPFSRQPLSTLDGLTIAALLTSLILCAILVGFIGASASILIVAVILLLVVSLIEAGMRWASALAFLLSGGSLVVFLFFQPSIINHLTHPQPDFARFVVTLLALASLAVTLAVSLGATMQNYQKRDQSKRFPQWLTSALVGVIGIVVGAVFIATFLPSATASSTGTITANSEPTVHMGAGSFLQSSVTVPKGAKLLLIDDFSALHILDNGSWQNGKPNTEREPGAPTLNNVQVNGNRVELGPFTTAGTYHIYCTVHQGMNLTIIVQ